MAHESKNRGGRPTAYKQEYCKQAKQLCLLGATDKQLADFFEVSEDTINEWKKKHRRFSESVKGGKMLADSKVAAALFKRAIGFRYDEVTFEKIDAKQNIDTAESDIKTGDTYKKKVVTKLIPPDPGAAMNWLKNRQKDLWRDKQTFDIDFDNLTDEQLNRILQLLQKKSNQ